MAKAKKKTSAKKAQKVKAAQVKKPAPKKVKAPVKAKAKAQSDKAKQTKTKPTKAVAVKAKFSAKSTPPAKMPALKKAKNIDYSKVVTPLGDRLLVRLVSAERMTAGGLYIPDTVSNVEGHVKGEVLAAGSGNLNKKGQKRPLDVMVGDKIYFNGYSATKVVFEQEELHIVKEVDVLGVAK